MRMYCSPNYEGAWLASMDENMRREEFPQLKGVTYLDHAGATLYSRSQLEAHVTGLAANLYGNPHSQSPSSQTSSAAVDHVRDTVLRFFGTDSSHHDVVFTSGCTAALKLLSECFPWQPRPPQTPPLPPPTIRQVVREVGDTTPHHERSEKREDDSAETPLVRGSSVVEKSAAVHKGSSGEVSSSEAERDSSGFVAGLSGKFIRTSVSVSYTGELKEAGLGGVACGTPGVGEGGGSVFCYLEDNHTSVVGMREVAAQFGASVVCATAEDIVGRSELENGIDHPDCGATLSKSVAFNCESGTASFQSGAEDSKETLHLFVYPAQSNFCGRKYPLDWCTLIPRGKLVISGVWPPHFPRHPPSSWKICLDAASFVGTNPLDLTECPADFVAVSFYKMFGFPTGLGALLVRRESAGLLHKRYYGGGTVFGTISRTGLHVPRSDLHERLEDGTIPFLEILALEHGFRTLSRLAGPMSVVAGHTFSLVKYVHDELSVMTHSNGAPVCLIYCSENFTDPSKQGAIVNFNLLRPSGDFVGYSEVSNLASVHDIHLRTGCFCNTGACMIYLHLDTSHILSHMKAGHVCGDTMDLINGRPTGSVRVSFGYMSTSDDAKKFVSFIHSNFRCSTESKSNDLVLSNSDFIGRVNSDVTAKKYDVVGGGEVKREAGKERSGRWLAVGGGVTAAAGSGRRTFTLDSIRLYPVKSCGALQVSEWLIGGCGLRYDRQWVVLSEHRACLSQKQEPRLSLILPFLDLHSQDLELQYEGRTSLMVSLGNGGQEEEEREGGERGGELVLAAGSVCQMRVCGDRVAGTDCGEAAASWLSDALSRDCRLVRQTQQRWSKTHSSATGGGDAPLLSLANEAQYLLVSTASAEHLLSEITRRHSKQLMSLGDLVSRFRPNLVVSGNGMMPYEEDEWSEVTIGGQKFKVTGRCSRCQTICVDQGAGSRSSEPLQTLLQLRGSRATFGIYLATLAFPSRSD